MPKFGGHQPKSTIAGIIIAGISILSMWALIYFKLSIGKKLNSAPILADAKCSLVCLYMSLVLLVVSVLWCLFKIPYIDILGTTALIFFSVKEGSEAFEKAEGIECWNIVSSKEKFTKQLLIINRKNMQTILIIINDAPYGSEKAYNVLRKKP